MTLPNILKLPFLTPHDCRSEKRARRRTLARAPDVLRQRLRPQSYSSIHASAVTLSCERVCQGLFDACSERLGGRFGKVTAIGPCD